MLGVWGGWAGEFAELLCPMIGFGLVGLAVGFLLGRMLRF